MDTQPLSDEESGMYEFPHLPVETPVLNLETAAPEVLEETTSLPDRLPSSLLNELPSSLPDCLPSSCSISGMASIPGSSSADGSPPSTSAPTDSRT